MDKRQDLPIMCSNPYPYNPSILNDVVLGLPEWKTPATSYPLSGCGAYRISRRSYPRGYYDMWGVNGYTYFKADKPLPITRLQERCNRRWHDWMVDDPPHWFAMENYAAGASGRVLVAGLGLGLIIHTLSRQSAVTRVDVVERSADIMALVGPLIPQRSDIVLHQADFWSFVKGLPSEAMYDCVIVDLWVADGVDQKTVLYWTEVLPAYDLLRKRFPSAKLVFHGFVACCDISPLGGEKGQK